MNPFPLLLIIILNRPIIISIITQIKRQSRFALRLHSVGLSLFLRNQVYNLIELMARPIMTGVFMPVLSFLQIGTKVVM